MTVKQPKMTMKSLQLELNVLREELKINRKELDDVKEELKNVKDVMKKETGTSEDPTGNSENEFTCKTCGQSFISQKTLKKHHQSKHTPRIKCKSCDKTFAKTCDLELHINENHDLVEHLECDHCGKTFVLKWRLTKHLEIHTNKTIRKCHYFNNQKCCPYEVIGCMFEHRISGKCKYGEKCNKTLCSFQHRNTDVSVNDLEANLDEAEKPSEIVSDGEIKAVSEINNDKSSDEDEESFLLYVKSNFEPVFKKFKEEKTIKCYYCDFFPRSTKLRDLETK